MLHPRQRAGEVDLVAPFPVGRLLVDVALGRRHQQAGQILAEHLGMKILLHGQHRQTGKLFDFEVALHLLVVFLDAPGNCQGTCRL